MGSTLLGFLSIVIFSLVYFLDFKLLHKVDEAILNSFAAGVGVVYIFIHMLPQLAHGQPILEESYNQSFLFGNSFAIYIIALAGFIFFYFFDQILVYTDQLPTKSYDKTMERSIYWANVFFVFTYNMLIGYVVGSYNLDSMTYQLVFLVAYFIHFVALKWGIYHVSPALYNEKARYPIVLGLFIGYFLALLFSISENIFVIIEAFITGAMILMVFKHELPNERDSKNRAFILGILLSLFLFILL